MLVNPKDPKYKNMKLWCVYGYRSSPKIFCCMILHHFGYLDPKSRIPIAIIWRYDIWGNRHLYVPSEPVDEFLKKETEGDRHLAFYDNQNEALDYIRRITDPMCDEGEHDHMSPIQF